MSLHDPAHLANANVDEYTALLQRLIVTQSYSREEHDTADILAGFLAERGVEVERYGNNVVARHRTTLASAPYLLLNSHHDTVRVGGGWTKDPFGGVVEDGKLYGLGSNDAGGPLMSMLATFMHLRTHEGLSHNIMFAATAEEEISGNDGMALLARTGVITAVASNEKSASNRSAALVALALVGEPTQMHMAVAERGLIVLDCVAHGRTGHAARSEGVNAIYEAMRDIEWFRTHRFERSSVMLGDVQLTVTQIEAGSQHNVVPDACRFVVDVRVTDAYTNEEVVEEIRKHVLCSVTPRSMRLRPSSTPHDHPIVNNAITMNMPLYGSPTMSDQSLLPAGIPSVKIGPGDSARSHTPDEYIGIDEIHKGIHTMIELCERFLEVSNSDDSLQEENL